MDYRTQMVEGTQELVLVVEEVVVVAVVAEEEVAEEEVGAVEVEAVEVAVVVGGASLSLVGAMAVAAAVVVVQRDVDL